MLYQLNLCVFNICSGNTESAIEKGHIYATADFNRSTLVYSPKEKRYDFISVNVRDEDDNLIEHLAQVLAFFEYSDTDAKEENKMYMPDYYACVAWLVDEEWVNENVQNKEDCTIPRGKQRAPSLFRRYQYQQERPNRVYIYSIDIIDCMAIVRHEYVIPDFYRSVNMPASKYQRFTHVPRRFADRSGWLVSTSEFEQHGISVSDVDKFLVESSTAHGAFMFKQHTESDFRAAISKGGSSSNADMRSIRRKTQPDEELLFETNFEYSDSDGDAAEDF
jgi:hypothetical protein